MSIYTENMSKISLKASPEEMAGKIARGERKASFHGVKKMSAIAVSAAAVMALTVSAGAAASWDFDAAVRSLFSVDDAESVSDRVAEMAVSDYVNEFEDAEFNFIGAVSDDIFTTVFLEVTRTDGGVFNCSRVVNDDIGYYYSDESGKLVGAELIGTDSIPGYDINKSGIGYHCGRPMLMDDGSNNDGKVTYAFVYDTDTLKEYSESDESVTIKYDIYAAGCRYIDDVSEILIFDWDPDDATEDFDGVKGYMGALVTVPFNNSGVSRTVSPKEPVALSVYGDGIFFDNKPVKEFDLSSICVTTASVSFEVRTELAPGDNSRWVWCEDEDFIVLNMKDGTEISVGGNNFSKVKNAIYGYEKWNLKFDYMLGSLIDPEDVESVTINGQTFFFE